MTNSRWPTLSLDIEPHTGRIHLHGGGKAITDTLKPGEFFTASIGEYTITFQRKRANKIMKMPRKEKVIHE
jgi:hypothetical protein